AIRTETGEHPGPRTKKGADESAPRLGCRGCDGPRHSPLGELEALPGLLVAKLLALDHSGVAGEEATVAEGVHEVGAEFLEGAGEALHDGPGLAGLAGAGDLDDHVDTVAHLGGLERGADVGLLDLEGEVGVGVLAVHLELAGALADAHPGDGRLAAAGAPDEG